MTAWKNFEKEVASFFGGLRRIRINYSESVEDITHPKYSIECKYGNQVPKYISGVDMPTSNGEYVLIPSTEWSWRIPCNRFVIKKLVKDRFIVDGIAQAYGYDRTKVPMLCAKPRGRRGFVIAMRYSDYMRGDV